MKYSVTLVKLSILSFGVKENRYSIDGTMSSLGEIDLSEITVSDDGNFKLVLGQEYKCE